MNYMKSRITQSFTLAVSALFLLSVYGLSLAQKAGTSEAVFYVT